MTTNRNAPERAAAQRLLSAREISARLTLSRSTLHRYRQDGSFPQPVRIGVRRIAWRESDVLRWLDEREAA